MELRLTVKTIKELKSQGFNSKYLDGCISWHSDNNVVSINTDKLDDNFIDALQEMAKANMSKESGFNSILQQISMLKSIKSNVDKVIPKRLDALRDAIRQYIKKDALDYYIYRLRDVNGVDIPLPYYVNNIFYKPAEKDSPAYVDISLKYISAMQENNERIIFYSSDIGNKTISELLQAKGYYKENPEIRKRFLEQYTKYKNIVESVGKQYKSKYIISHDRHYGSGKITGDGSYMKFINDMDIITNKIPNNYVSSIFWMMDTETNIDHIIPTHPFVYMFSLDKHKNMWIHTESLEEYIYDPKLKDKLVLPSNINKLIDILTLNTKENYEDIISGKTGGTIIICKGVPGTGKTLSAEVYSEVIEKPLYKVQSDQLGIRVDDLEKNLEQVLKRASRWGAILLIDEADVYIQSRDQDLHRNAVVCTFLRTLEYYNGLLFMTTNRSSSIDDAVLSRATAIVEYCVPKNEELTKLWDVLLNNYNIAIKDGELPSIISHFKNITGRSIKNICKLTKKYYGDKQINLDMLKDIEGYVYINKDY